MTKDLNSVWLAREFILSWKEGDSFAVLNDLLLNANAFTRLAMYGAMLNMTSNRPEKNNFDRMRVMREWRKAPVNGEDPQVLIMSAFKELYPGFDGFVPADFDDDSITEHPVPYTVTEYGTP